MKASDYIVSYFESKGVNVIFGYIGGTITHLVDSIGNNKNMKYIQTYHEQTAAIAAEGYAIESGKFGVAISTSGPGVTNMMTGIADAYFDSIPVVFISGQVNSYEYKYDKPVRQQGFQEMDVVNVVKPITKYAKLLDDVSNLKYELQKAVYIANEGRKGPVMLDIPMNIQRTDINPEELISFCIPIKKQNIVDIESVLNLLSDAKRPMLLIGGGCKGYSTKRLIESFIEKTQMPVVTSLMGRGIINETYTNYLGMIGSYGNRCANMGIANADILIALGTRLDTRQTGAKIDTFLNKSIIIQVDIDKNELDYNRLKNRIKINERVLDFLQSILSGNTSFYKYTSWNSYLYKLKQNYNQNREIERFVINKAPYRFMQKLNELTNENDVITTDIGQNQMWAAQTIQLKKGQHFLTSGGLAPMGFSLPAAIGVAFANPDKTIYCLNGDGGFHMAIQSLLLISQYQLNIKVIVLNNESLGMITQFQHLYFDNRMNGTTVDGGYLAPDIENLAISYKIPYIKITEKDLKDKDKIKYIMSHNNIIIDYRIKGLTSVCPKLEYNKPIYMPMPLLDERELKENMLIPVYDNIENE